MTISGDPANPILHERNVDLSIYSDADLETMRIMSKGKVRPCVSSRNAEMRSETFWVGPAEDDELLPVERLAVTRAAFTAVYVDCSRPECADSGRSGGELSTPLRRLQARLLSEEPNARGPRVATRP